MTKKVKRKKFDALQSFYNAAGFHFASRVIDTWGRLRQEGYPAEREVLIMPMMVNEAFGLEMFIKTLYRIRRRYADRKHGILDLFYQLSKADQKRITTHFDRIVGGHPDYAWIVSQNVPMDVRSVLLRANSLFTIGRYWHEQLPISRDQLGFASNAGVGNLSDAIREVIYEKHPEWQELLHTARMSLGRPTQSTSPVHCIPVPLDALAFCFVVDSQSPDPRPQSMFDP